MRRAGIELRYRTSIHQKPIGAKLRKARCHMWYLASSPVDGDTAQESAGILKPQHELFEQGKEYYIDIQPYD
ncbi:hypothetical protein [Citrobacter braakii]|uniref:hypothetical protein n=1 Tax=Citrobacter braakii TaxID=57706 RepID=UPI001904EDB0|nr:hypothetical protein [Citrobacter braakii]EGT0622068.1 hypothetical protein [Citrobacter braakii]MBJ8846392.1 hypothetical protein [Citrobacter braakii]